MDGPYLNNNYFAMTLWWASCFCLTALIGDRIYLEGRPWPVWPDGYLFRFGHFYNEIWLLSKCFSQSRFKTMTNIKSNIKEFLKNINILRKWRNFCQIWSHWPWPNLVTLTLTKAGQQSIYVCQQQRWPSSLIGCCSKA